VARSLQAGERVSSRCPRRSPTASRSITPGARRGRSSASLVDDVVTVSDARFVATDEAALRAREVVAEPSGAERAGRAAAGRGGAARAGCRRVVSGGNVDAARFAALVSEASVFGFFVVTVLRVGSAWR
jgi:threonine dehydratase